MLLQFVDRRYVVMIMLIYAILKLIASQKSLDYKSVPLCPFRKCRAVEGGRGQVCFGFEKCFKMDGTASQRCISKFNIEVRICIPAIQ